jgi:hypothetical protein
MEIDRGDNTKKWASIARPCPIELGPEAFAKSVRNYDGMQIGLLFGGCPEKSAPLWCAQPFVAIADVPVYADPVKIERYLAWPVRAINQHWNPC